MVAAVDLPPLTDAQIAGYARQAGFSGQALATMIAIVLAESGGDPDIRGDISLQNATWGPSVGLAQVRSLKAETGTGRPRDATRLTDPSFNLRSAFSISSGGTRFSPWTMFTNQRYRQFLDRAWRAIAGGGTTGGGGGVQTAAGGGGGGDDQSFVERIVEPIGSSLARIVLVGVLVAGGIALVAAGSWKGTEPIRKPVVDATLTATLGVP